ncbi:MAG: discoidin domain-containing protein [Bacteroidetes bacterium]|nr:discoidin domain-containing protein [Bacteroidota bacterium]
MKHKLFCFLLAGICCTAVSVAQPTPARDTLRERFLHPPASAKPWVFWYWMQAAVSKEGITADLEAMKEAGIGGAYLMPIKDTANPPLMQPPVRQLSPLWWEMVRFAMQEAKRLGLELSLHISDGFALAGGPWIRPEESMQKITWSQVEVEGGKLYDEPLPLPKANENYYRDIAVYAFPAPGGEELSLLNVKPVVSSSKAGMDVQFLAQSGSRSSFRSDEPCWIQYDFGKPFTCRTIVVHSVNNYQSQRLLLQVSDDGQTFRSIGRLQAPRHGWQDNDADVTHSIAATTARYFRFVYDVNGSGPGAEDLDAAKWKPVLKLNGITLSSAPRIHQYEGKTGEVWRISPRSTTEQIPDSVCVPMDKLVNLSAQMDGTGRLRWNVPPGRWVIMRMGHTTTGHTNATGGGGKGLECDKFNTAAVRRQFDHWFGEALRQAGPTLAAVVTVLHVDSWECGSQNWSPVFRDAFRKKRGYDPLPYLPVMAGVPLQSAEVSERFLYDIRNTIAELVNDSFYTTVAALAHGKGCLLSAESVAPTMVSDGMLHYRTADIPMGEFWLHSPTHDKPNDMLDAISGAHVYGKKIVQAESFTTLRMAWDEYPGMLKPLQDRNYALGINRTVFHVFAHNPWLDRKPGMTLDGVGLYFQRDQTWWKQEKAWMDYTQRCQSLLQVGVPVADIAVFTGEDLPRRAQLPNRLTDVLPGLMGSVKVHEEKRKWQNEGNPIREQPVGVFATANTEDAGDWLNILNGYQYDSFNPDALLRLAKVQQGRIVLPGGASYALLVIPGIQAMQPNAQRMSAAAASSILRLVKEGATVLMADTLKGSAGLLHKEENDKTVRAVYAQLMAGPFRGITAKEGGLYKISALGKGHVIQGAWTLSSLSALGVRPDFMVEGGPEKTGDITYTHRRAQGLDIYFISNQRDEYRDMNIYLRAAGRLPELWDAVTGEIKALDEWEFTRDGRTYLPLKLNPSGSVFIIFRKPATEAVAKAARALRIEMAAPHTVMTTIPMQLNDDWNIQFDTAYGGPASPIHTSLTDWSKSADSAVRYYSGTAVYTCSFSLNTSPHDGQMLGLGKVGVIAHVWVNGVDCGILWTEPWVMDIGRALKNGVNTLRIEVSNTWANRLQGDRRLPEGKRRIWTTAPLKYLEGKELPPSGLIGPVRIWNRL